MTNIRVFYHICAINHCPDVVREYIKILHFSGLYEACYDINIYICGDPNIITIIRTLLMEAGSKFKIRRESPEDTSYERLTLLGMREYIKPDDLILYTHSKSVSRPDSRKNVEDWSTFMYYNLIGKFKKCVELLKTVDVVGVNYQVKPRPHFSGNFWWATGEYISKLPTIIGPNYYAPELEYLFSCCPKVATLGHSGVNHYLTSFSMKKYVD